MHGEGEYFRLLGPTFDAKLTMHTAVKNIMKKTRPKTYALLKARRMYSTSDMVLQFKTHIWSILESSIPAIYHAADSILAPLDGLQTHFAHELGLKKLMLSLNTIWLRCVCAATLL